MVSSENTIMSLRKFPEAPLCRASVQIAPLIESGGSMEQMSEEERQRILASSPVGTFALMAAVIGGMVVAWLFLYYGVFLPRG
jgi:hypothetical protein